MRHYVELPRRLPSARKIARTRSRALPVLLALPLVAFLWITIGLPILSNATSASASDLRSHNAFFRGSGAGASGGSRGENGASQTVSFTTFSQAVLRSVGIGSSSAPVRLPATTLRGGAVGSQSP